MMKNKTPICLLLMLTVILFCAGCGGNGSGNTETKPSETTALSTSQKKESITQQSSTQEKRGELADFKILLDAGHGCTKTYTEQVAPGSDKTTVESPNTGATGVSSGRHESELTLAVALKLQKALKALGAEVYMVRSAKTTDMSLHQRAEMGNELGVDLVLRIHADGVDDSSVRGAGLLYPSTDYTEPGIVSKSKKAAECILKEYIAKTKLNDRGIIERNDLVGFNFTTVPSVLIELGFMSNPEEDELMWEPSFQQKMTDGIVNGILKFK